MNNWRYSKDELPEDNEYVVVEYGNNYHDVMLFKKGISLFTRNQMKMGFTQNPDIPIISPLSGAGFIKRAILERFEDESVDNKYPYAWFHNASGIKLKSTEVKRWCYIPR